jgi:hypothetical protein
LKHIETSQIWGFFSDLLQEKNSNLDLFGIDLGLPASNQALQWKNHLFQ